MFLRKGFRLGLVILLIAIIFMWTSGRLLDWEAERVVHQAYSRDQNGIVENMQTIAIVKGHKKALVFIHAFFNSPYSFSTAIHDIQNKVDSDIYAPLLPYQGRDLEIGAEFNEEKIVEFVRRYLQDLSGKYESVTVVGMSFGGAVLIDLLEKGLLPKNVNVILQSPAIFIKTNTASLRMLAHVYGWWRTYCNYTQMHCPNQPESSLEPVARVEARKNKTLLYLVMPALLELYKLDSSIRNSFTQIRRPFSLLVAVDDNLVWFEKQQAACEANKTYCHFYAFPSGRHYIHWGSHKNEYEALLVKLTN